MAARVLVLAFCACSCDAFVRDSTLRASRRPLSVRHPPSMVGTVTATAAFLTREDGKNGKLQSLLSARGVPTAELPCIAFERLPGYKELCDALVHSDHDWVVVTSPEAAGVFLEAWHSCKEPPPRATRIASVGAGTAAVLADAGMPVDFVPSKATGQTLAKELPAVDGSGGDSGAVLYPASALAATVVESGLQSRGFRTRRIETYTTVAASWDAAELERARAAQVVTFASPSAVRVWAERVGTAATAVCIGETSAEEARGLGFESVHCPDKPGVESWAECVSGLALWNAQ